MKPKYEVRVKLGQQDYVTVTVTLPARLLDDSKLPTQEAYVLAQEVAERFIVRTLETIAEARHVRPR